VLMTIEQERRRTRRAISYRPHPLLPPDARIATIKFAALTRRSSRTATATTNRLLPQAPRPSKLQFRPGGFDSAQAGRLNINVGSRTSNFQNPALRDLHPQIDGV
jgi:hypothetical protein